MPKDFLYQEATSADVPAMARCRAADPEAGPADERMARYLDGHHRPQDALAPRTAFVAHRSGEVVAWFEQRGIRRVRVNVDVESPATRMRFRLAFMGISIVILAACGGASTRARSSGSEQAGAIALTDVRCYVVCDSLEARIHASGMVVRREGGAVLGRDRERVPRHGTDTVWAERGSLDSLRASLAAVAERRLDTTYHQAEPPCDARFTTHTPIVSLTWTDRGGTHHLVYDLGCGEPSGLLDATARYAQQTALWRGVPVRSR